MLVATGLVAGAINSVAGGGSLLTFPTLVGLGNSPLVANVTNTVGVAPGNLGGVVGFRRQLGDQRPALLRCGLCGALGAVGGGTLLLATPASALRYIVPALIALASLLVLAQPRVTSAMRRRSLEAHPVHPWVAAAGVGVVSVYGGYFGAAMGVVLIAVLGILAPDTLQRINALKTAITLVVNGVSALLFAIFAPVVWDAALTIAAATTVGGYVGAAVASRLPDVVLRAVIVAIGLGAAAYVGLRA